MCPLKVIKWRWGVPGATGPCTAAYNVAEKGDPNAAGGEARPTERQYLIK